MGLYSSSSPHRPNDECLLRRDIFVANTKSLRPPVKDRIIRDARLLIPMGRNKLCVFTFQQPMLAPEKDLIAPEKLDPGGIQDASPHH
jgi:hypothetical protein